MASGGASEGVSLGQGPRPGVSKRPSPRSRRQAWGAVLALSLLAACKSSTVTTTPDPSTSVPSSSAAARRLEVGSARAVDDVPAPGPPGCPAGSGKCLGEALGLAEVPCRSEVLGASAVLIDGRQLETAPDCGSKLAEAHQRWLFEAAFPGAKVSCQETQIGCTPKGPPGEAFEVSFMGASAIRGAFTAAERDEVAWVVQARADQLPEFSANQARVVITQGERVVARSKSDSGTDQVHLVRAVQAAGQEAQLVVVSEVAKMDAHHKWAQRWTAHGGQLKLLEIIDLLDGGLGGPALGPEVDTATVVRRAGTASGEFLLTEEHWRRRCQPKEIAAPPPPGMPVCAGTLADWKKLGTTGKKRP